MSPSPPHDCAREADSSLIPVLAESQLMRAITLVGCNKELEAERPRTVRSTNQPNDDSNSSLLKLEFE